MRFPIVNTNVLGLAIVGALAANAQDTANTDYVDSITSSTSTDATTATASTSSSAASSTATTIATSAMIPTSISSTCTSFLNTLDSDPAFSTCMTPLVNITAIYDPTSSDAANLTTTTSDVVATLSSLCSASTGCSDGLIRSYLADFYTACTPELTGSNGGSYSESIRLMYDYLYTVQPFLAAVCGKDTSTKTYCVLEIASSALSNATSPAGNGTSNAVKLNSLLATSELSAAQVVMDTVSQAAANLVIYTTSASSTLTRRMLNAFVARGPDDASSDSTDSTQILDSQTIVTPNTTTYRLTSLPYLFLQPNTTSSVMCTSCTTSIMSAYVAWEAQVPYALGLASSPILGAQAALWKAISSTCGTNFTTAITAQAGVLVANGTLIAATSGAEAVVGTGMFGLAIAGLVGLGMSVLA